MKEHKRKYFLKSAVSLFIAIIMVASTFIAIANTDESQENPVFKTSGLVYVNGRSTTEPSFLEKQDEWIHYDDGINVNSIGLTSGGYFQWGIRITPDELAGYDDYILTTVKFHHGQAGQPPCQNSGNVYVYEEGTSTSPGAQIPSATTPWDDNGTGWVEIELATPVPIDTSEEIWVTIDVTNAPGEYPAGVDIGPMVQDKGGFISMDGVTWNQINEYELDYNWNLWAGLDLSNEPPETPDAPEGPTEGTIGEEYTFTASTTDPDGDDIYYLFDWGNGENSNWTGPYASGAEAQASYTWDDVGTYDVTVKAKDVNDEESNFSPAHQIVISEQGAIEIGEIIGGLGVAAEILNNGSVVVTDVQWTITIEGGLIILTPDESGNITSIAVGDSEYATMSVLGIGLGLIKDGPTITVSATVDGNTVQKTVSAKIIGPFVLII